MNILARLLDLEKNPAARTYNAEEYNLEAFKAWLEGLGAPQRGQRFLHVAGTKGKGSTAAIAEALLGGLGFPTAMFTSPHLEHHGERFRFDGVPLTAREFDEALGNFVKDLPPGMRQNLDGPANYRTVFELLTALGLVLFRDRQRELEGEGRARPQIVVWEVGLGGRLDCTNVVDPVVSVITTLGMDHTKLLGSSIEEIAREKAGIIKPGRPVVVGRQDERHFEGAWGAIVEAAERAGAPLVRAWKHNPVLESRQTADGQWVRMRLPDGEEAEGMFPLHGAHQLGNLEAAVAAVWYVIRSEEKRPRGADLLAGLGNIHWPGRMEVVRKEGRGTLVLDGAHCPLSARKLGESLRGWNESPEESLPKGPFVVLWSMQKDKDHEGFLRELVENCGYENIESLQIYPLQSVRGASLEALETAAAAVNLGFELNDSLERAYEAAVEKRLTLVCCGTLYSLFTLRSLWEQNEI